MAGCISRAVGNVHFLLLGFPVTPPRNHNHPQLGGSTPADGGVKGLPWKGHISPHGGPERCYSACRATVVHGTSFRLFLWCRITMVLIIEYPKTSTHRMVVLLEAFCLM